MSSKRFEIDRVPASIGFDEFRSRYFEPELPVVIEGIGPAIQRSHDLSIGNIREKIVETGLAAVNTVWFEGPAEMLEQLVDTPEVVARVLKDSHRRKSHCRLWLNGEGNFTPSHYDGNLLYVFNLQLKGRKEWRIVSPHTPLRNYPFSRGALFGDGDDGKPNQKGMEYCDFALDEGDMIYLPPFWHHAVKATAEQNINVNWVASRKSGFVESEAFCRERELLKFALLCYNMNGRTKLLNLILGAGIEGYLENFAGVGWDFIRELTQDVKWHRVATRVLKELAFLGFALKDLGKIRGQLKTKPLDSLRESPAAV